jgi:hypothetical protein
MSAILSADDLNDFISPGVACIKPVETLPPKDTKNQEVCPLIDPLGPCDIRVSFTDFLIIGCL